MTLPNGISAAYSYDVAGRLTGMKYSKGTQVLRDLVYGYDEINRRTSYSGNTAPEPQETATNTATVDASNRYTSLNGKSISHDENGNQTINNAVWDARDRLVGLSGPGFTASFTYDVMGRRTSKTVNGQTKTYLYDGSDLISETGAEYTFGPGIDQPLERKSGQNEYYLSDALGSVIGLADPSGAIKTSYNYSPFGKKQATGINSSNPFAFTGREDDGTGYYYYRARYYNPDQKRFISEDPLEFGGGDTNLQAYVGNSPIDFNDPSGQCVICVVYKSIPNTASQAEHAFVLTRDKNEKPNYYRGGPEGFGFYGNDFKTQSGPYITGTADYDTTEGKRYRGKDTVLNNDKPCEIYDNFLRDLTKKIQDGGLKYYAVDLSLKGQNSNSFAYTLLKAAQEKVDNKISLPDSNRSRNTQDGYRINVPGWGVDLRRLIKNK
jgi:RHS repeat-associated protein